MRATLRLLASVKPARYLEPGNPTGLTGLFNHPAPRSTLIYIYGSTLEKLKALPEHSVYRQSTEAITKHRMQIIQSIKPAGYEEWAKNAAETLEKHPEAFQPEGEYKHQSIGGQPYVSSRNSGQQRYEDEESAYLAKSGSTEWSTVPGWEPEPPLEISQCVRPLVDVLITTELMIAHRIEDAETQIGAGLIEEVIEVAEGELKLVDTMIESKVYVQCLCQKTAENKRLLANCCIS